MPVDFLIWVAVAASIVWVAFSFRVLKEDERLAMFMSGRFVHLRGPGLIPTIPFGNATYVRISLGAEGQIQSDTLVKINDGSIPYTSTKRVRAGDVVRVVGFSPAGVEVDIEDRYVVCESCGHKNKI